MTDEQFKIMDEKLGKLVAAIPKAGKVPFQTYTGKPDTKPAYVAPVQFIEPYQGFPGGMNTLTGEPFQDEAEWTAFKLKVGWKCK